MGKYKFGRTSRLRLATCHVDLHLIMITALNLSDVDFGIAEGFRTVEKQQRYFREGKSKIDGVKRKGKHNYNPALAVDIYPYVNGRAEYDPEHVSYLAGLIQGIAELLYRSGKVTHRLRWGGNWDMDGEILLDQSFDDRPHFELING